MASSRTLTLRVNDHDHRVDATTRETLLDTLRDVLGLTGTKDACRTGSCGACTVLLDGRRVNSCLVLTVMVGARAITTIEGVARGDELHPLQRNFVEADALQCGFCTPGQIMSALGYLAERGTDFASPDVIRDNMSGNICRCGAYPNIVRAIQASARGASNE